MPLTPEQLKLLTQFMLKDIKAEDKPLQEPSIPHELATRYYKPNMQRQMELMFNIGPAMFGMMPQAGAVEEATEVPGLISQLASKMPEGKTKALTDLFTRLGSKPTEMAGNLFDKMTTFLEPGGGETKPFKPSALSRDYPGATGYLGQQGEPGLLVEPLKPPTAPLKRYEAYNPEGRFHGTPNPIAELRERGVLDSPDNLQGPGLYTSNNRTVTEGYAQIKGEEGSPGSVQYKVHQVKPVRWLDGDKPIPKEVARRMAEVVGSDYGPEATHTYGAYTDIGATKSRGPTPKEWVEAYTYEYGSRYGINGWKILHDAAEAEGYGGLKHRGGGIVGKVGHDVKVYWYPEEQVRLRPAKGAMGKLEVPKVGKSSGRGPTPKYVRDPLKTAKLSLKDTMEMK